MRRSRRGDAWAVPAFAVVMGGVMFAAAWAGGEFSLGVRFFAIMAVYAALISLLGGRFDVVRILRGQTADERHRSFDLRATAFAGSVTIFALIGGFLYELARGRDGQPFATLCAAAGISYLASLFWLDRRS